MSGKASPKSNHSIAIRVCKAFLTIFIVYHLLTVLIMPISGSMLGRRMGHVFSPYANLLGFNNTWQFFSPGPSPMFYLEYEVEKTDSDAIASQVSFYPPAREKLTWDDGWNRRLFGMRFFSLNGDLLERFLGPYLCRQNPDAQAISVKRVFEKVEDIERIGEWADFRELSQRLDLPRQRILCPAGAANGNE